MFDQSFYVSGIFHGHTLFIFDLTKFTMTILFHRKYAEIN